MKMIPSSSLRALLAPGLVALASVAGCASNAPAPAAPVAPPVTTNAAQVDPRILGSADAQVMIIEFTDLQCP